LSAVVFRSKEFHTIAIPVSHLNPYTSFVSEFAQIAREARRYPLGHLTPPPRPALPPHAPKALIFSPHPDDETITGGLALRLLRECQWRIVNVAVTLGSKRERRAALLNELKGACRYLGFDLQTTVPGGLERITTAARAGDPKHWAKSVAVIGKILRQHQPTAIFLPHQGDWHGTHVGVHWLVMDALAAAPELDCYVVETEFWGQMPNPNLMVEYSVNDLADLVAATSFHLGEVKRNPYHLRLPAWMEDNVRRGAELVGGQGRSAPVFQFGQLFRLRRRLAGRLEEFLDSGRVLPASTSPDVIFSR
jgi:LmbE family N-acetylglucosaminyl deacetylase